MIIDAIEFSIFIIVLGLLGYTLGFLVDYFIYSNEPTYKFLENVWNSIVSFIERFGKK